MIFFEGRVHFYLSGENVNLFFEYIFILNQAYIPGNMKDMYKMLYSTNFKVYKKISVSLEFFHQIR